MEYESKKSALLTSFFITYRMARPVIESKIQNLKLLP